MKTFASKSSLHSFMKPGLVMSLLGVASPAGAAIIAGANFTDMSIPSSVSTVNPVAGANDFAWTTSSGFLTQSDDGAGGINGGTALRIDSTSSWQGMIGTMASTTTLNVGETITLTITGRYVESPLNVGGGLRLGFIDPNDLDNNFSANMGTGGNTGFTLFRDGIDPGDNSPGTGGSSLTATTSGTAYTTLSTSPYTAIFSITRNASDYTIMADVNGAIRTATSDAGWNSYNSIFIRNAGAGHDADFLIDNVSVTLIPEPDSGLMLMAAATGIALLRRRPRA